MGKLAFLKLALGILITSQLNGMDFTSQKLHRWKRGESMGGEEFIAANEDVVDYLATLERPTDPLKSITYQCEVKTRDISPTVQNNNAGTTNTFSYVYLKTLYAIRNCVRIN